MSNKPTRGTPLTEAERAVPRNQGGKGWQAGPRYHKPKSYRGGSNNQGVRKGGKKSSVAKVRTEVVRPVIVPKWARKYA